MRSAEPSSKTSFLPKASASTFLVRSSQSHTVEILSVGTELLLGNIANTDAQMLSQGLSELGLNVFWHTVVGDNLQRAEEAVALAKKLPEQFLSNFRKLQEITGKPRAAEPFF